MRELTQGVQIVGGIRDGKKLWPLGRETGERPVCPRISPRISSGFPPLSRLLSVLHQASGTTIDGASYTYDNAGNRTSKTNDLNGITENYTYDALYELTQVTQGGSTTESYSYDLVGNKLSSLGVPTYNYNSSNELTSSSQGSYTYDANGNTLTDLQGRSYTWDFENRLTQVVNPGVGTTTLRYDPFGRRIYKNSVGGGVAYIYDGDNIIEVIDSNGGVLARYADTRTVDEELAESISGGVNFYEQDAAESITSLTDDAGALSNSYGYTSFGQEHTVTGAFARFRYIGRETDAETGLSYYRARYYDSTSGRYISEDPCRSEVAWSWYDYASNNPISYGDWLGCKGAKVPPPNLPRGVSKNLARFFHDGWDEMLNRLNNKSCQKFFCDHGDSHDKIINTLQNTSYRFEPYPPDTGAVTNPDGSVYIEWNTCNSRRWPRHHCTQAMQFGQPIRCQGIYSLA